MTLALAAAFAAAPAGTASAQPASTQTAAPSEDGIHPNAQGARVLADNIWPYLLPLARSVASAAVEG
jgi:lysophospholipase L1-like esterase